MTDRVAPGVVYTTFHHPETQANVVTTDFSDWATNCPEYKVTAVQVALSNGPSEWQEEYAAQAEMARRILKEAAACTERGELGALLRREGLYSSHLNEWRKQAARGELAGLTPRKRGRKAKAVDPRDKELERLKRENARLTHRAQRAEALVELQKKVSEMLGIALPSPTDEETE